jgi:hypothetical protein
MVPLVRRAHALGERPVGELLFALAKALDGEDELERLLTDYGRFSPELMRAMGADRFPTRRPLRVPPELLRRAVP